MTPSYRTHGHKSTPAHTPAPIFTPTLTPTPKPEAAAPLPPEALRAVADLLGAGPVIAYRPLFAHAFGGAACALLLSQFWFWTHCPTVRARGGDGWFWKSQKEITQETGLSRCETDTARRKLAALGVLEQDRRGVPATLHFRLDKEQVYRRLWAHLQRTQTPPAPPQESPTPPEERPAPGADPQFVGFPQTGLPKTDKLVRGKPANKLAANPQTIPETPSERTQKKTQTPRAAPSPAASPEKTGRGGVTGGPALSQDQQAVNQRGAALFRAALQEAARQAARAPHLAGPPTPLPFPPPAPPHKAALDLGRVSGPSGRPPSNGLSSQPAGGLAVPTTG